MRRSSGIVVRDIGGETVLVPTGQRVLDMGSLVVLNSTGRFVWERLDGNQTPDQIAAALADSFEVTPDSARSDVENFIGELKQNGLVEDGGPAAE